MNQSKLAVNSRSERKAGKGGGGGGTGAAGKGRKMSASKLWLVLGVTSDWMEK